MKQLKSTDHIPSHIAIIMDGNRRWARKRGLPDIKGHEEGAETLEKIVEAAAKMGVKTVTVYALSTENLKERAKRELAGLFGLMRSSYNTKIKKMMGNGVKVSILGQLEGLPQAIKNMVGELKKTYIENESIKLNIALNYGGKKELLDAVKNIIKKGVDVNKINETTIDEHLYTKGDTNPELVIRTGGRIRLSNFLLWQTAYSELYFSKKLWPDFTPEDLKKAIIWYQTQQRNFGK
ncbi:MAG: Undecaprenyl diphosphate synthase [uncultured bacterium]|uniref:Isoprenyl transferase n=3 Tax=Candidatus Daviesiibacteriota TaxID=1752718 RepID=A0A0G0HVR0_9BACT|nr:MAG: Undecaprenyl diphosphate synthase [uncultured bacterium]KKQ07981.1 MAG: Isoprenyl transferase [Candidatus Daviesbacteria bacterium GW2011_GWB1_36_5]KKQ16165.1 MAG: Isoprenyl transferase [Candidatus Daviesbacteria bacterium GW2011_GWA1_36_8]OGE33242.1 MAG: di-trans,poly-cis-decaprenylcistransferase [Candidatus Daviesbacteria bacterium RIFCSPHIGHO2_02_FULL_37_9]OGE36144.1 MAG: di-trans,poly-cis-decaprenylcistransferase [Candidatus Daviesbacteria bacterium RIFCSPHIGHO2_12_FULL_37_16]